MVTWTLLCVALCAGEIYIYSPEELRIEIYSKHQNPVIPSSLGNFGNPPYGTVLAGRVFSPAAGEETACTRLTSIDFREGDPDRIISPILLVNRGQCSFSVKVRNAQNIGASAVIVADNVEESMTRIIMIDDGSSGNLIIPSLMISNSDAAIVRKYIREDDEDPAVLTITFEMKHPDDRVEYSMWTSSEHSFSRDFLNEFAVWGSRFNDDTALFTPHYVLWYCADCRLNHFNGTDHKDCFSSGRYCAPDPDFEGPRTGRDIVGEDLRQLCIYEMTKDQDNENLWWDYIAAFVTLCPLSNFTRECSERAMGTVGINVAEVQLCVTHSFGGENADPIHADNTMLEKERGLFVDTGISYYPIVVVNEQVVRGDLEVSEIMTALCAGFVHRPPVCDRFFSQNQKDDNRNGASGSKMSIWVILLIIAGSMIALAALLLLYRLWLRRELRDSMKYRVSNTVSQYIALSESSH